jgi:hypothetical protein
MSYMRQMQLLADEFFRETAKVSATKTEMADWAIRTGRWNRQEEVARKQCADDFAEALRVEYETDPKGRRVRTKYAATLDRDGKKQTYWGDRKNVGREFIEVSAKQQRNRIAGELYQIKVDLDSFNELYNDGEPIQIPLDFTPDIEELEEMARRRNKRGS